MTPGYAINEAYKPELKKLPKKYTLEEICEGMETAIRQYLKLDENGKR